MPTVPQYHREVSAQLTPTPEIRVQTNGDMFGENVYKAQANLGKAAGDFLDGMIAIKERIDNTKILELANRNAEWEQQNLYDKDNGYLYKFGKDAYGQSESLLKNYDQYMNDYISKSGFSPAAKRRAQETATRLRSRVMYEVTRHDFQQGVEWSKNEAQTAQINYLNTAVNFRNNPEEINKAIQSGYQAIEMQGEIQHLDSTAINLQKMKYRSDVHEAVFSALLGEGSLEAGRYLEAHKNEIDPAKLPHYISAAKNEEMKYQARSIADNLFLTSANEEEALKKAEAIEDINLSDSVAQRVRQKYSLKRRLEEQQQADLIDNYINSAVQKIQNGEIVTEDDIPQGLDGKHYLQAKHQLDYINQFGDTRTEADTYTQLWYTASYDAQRFKDMDLSLYRLSLSQKDYDALTKRQQAIQKGDYFTTMTNSGAVEKYIEQVTGLSGNKEVKVFEQYQNMVREHELRTGRKVTDIEKEQFLKYLGTDNNNYKKIEQAMKDNADFHKELSNKINYYQARHNGDLPDTDMVNQWIREQSIEYKSGKYAALKENAIRNTVKIANEQITLTNFADNYVPDLSKKVGAQLNVTSRYRAANGKYTSRHSEGRALDIGYTSKDGKQLTLNQKIKTIEEVLQRPDVEKIAISSKDADGKAILQYMMKHYGKKYGSKIQDMNIKDANGKTRDENLGTNHTNHLHITLYKDNTFNGNDVIAMKNQLKSRGYNSQQIDLYLKQKGII